VKNAKWRNRTHPNTYVQYMEDLKFWVLASGNDHRLPEKEIVKIFVSELKPDIFREEIYSRSFETLADVMAKTRHELSNYRDIIEISERIKRPEMKKSLKIGFQNRIYLGKQEATPILQLRCSIVD